VGKGAHRGKKGEGKQDYHFLAPGYKRKTGWKGNSFPNLGKKKKKKKWRLSIPPFAGENWQKGKKGKGEKNKLVPSFRGEREENGDQYWRRGGAKGRGRKKGLSFHRGKEIGVFSMRGGWKNFSLQKGEEGNEKRQEKKKVPGTLMFWGGGGGDKFSHFQQEKGKGEGEGKGEPIGGRRGRKKALFFFNILKGKGVGRGEKRGYVAEKKRRDLFQLG